MKRIDFTKNISTLIVLGTNLGYRLILNEVWRSRKRQIELFNSGKSKCDGVNLRSKHQNGCAGDLYAINEKGKILEDNETDAYRVLHYIWEKMGGRSPIQWVNNKGKVIIDWGHFE